MSEYQYYEFLALDQPLSDDAYEYVRDLSTRAEITRTRFVNEYQWGDFRGNPSALMDLCYDAHLYFANWGTRILMLRLPPSWLALDTAAEYCNDETFSARRSGKNIVLEFQSQDESGEDWGYEVPGSLGLFVGIRNELSAGDLRPLYLAWLAGAYYVLDENEGDQSDGDQEDDYEVEPPVPAGLAQLTAPQRALADFLRVDQDLLKAAAEASAPIVDKPAADQNGAMDSWIDGLTKKQKDETLRRLLSDDHARARKEILRSLQPCAPKPSTVRRRMSSLMAAAASQADIREAERQQELERQQGLRDLEAQRHRESQLALLSDRGERPWADVADLIAAKKPTSYDAAIRLLTDLAEISRRRGRSAQFAERLAELRSAHQRKPSLIERLDAADLP
ncbi:hypothetical protein [Catenulispora pinisilvae]|uniref:hypothetical protein n=1 Tax=Catenulispora pinisilvae TaxID=2705253 RepID=UPI001891C029|nr:hypothetical protein [Catenulispora pinisilvae]